MRVEGAQARYGIGMDGRAANKSALSCRRSSSTMPIMFIWEYWLWHYYSKITTTLMDTSRNRDRSFVRY